VVEGVEVVLVVGLGLGFGNNGFLNETGAASGGFFFFNVSFLYIF
jgi:hypothetical protein